MASQNVETPAKSAGRRRLLLALGGLAAFYAGSRWWLTRPAPLNFQPAPGLPGFRRLVDGPVSQAAFDPLIGLDRRAEPLPEIGDDLKPLLFPGDAAGRVPVAYFADFRCPNCAELERLLRVHIEAGEIRLFRHEWPILGPASVEAARAALAAAMQGRAGALDGGLTSSRLIVTAAYLRRIAGRAGLDAERLLADMRAPEVDAKLALVRALARRLGFYATPSMVMGRTLVIGQVPAPTLAALVAEEAARA